MATIGYYVHHQGRGHLHRWRAIRSEIDGHELVALSELPTDGVVLSSDVPPDIVDAEAGGALHWAPLDGRTGARRVGEVVDWIRRAEPVGAVVDVSVEMTLLMRLCGVPTVVVRQHGRRTDAAHVAAYRSAAWLLAPFPRVLEHPSTPSWIRRKTTYAGFISGVARGSTERDDVVVPDAEDVVVLWGRGGGRLSSEAFDALVAAARPGRVWCLGEVAAAAATSEPERVVDVGWSDDVAGYLRAGPVVVAAAGNNAVADAATNGCGLVAVAQRRPFGEQAMHVESLVAAEVASTVGDTAGEAAWSVALDEARRTRPALACLARSNDGARTAASAIVEVLVTG